MTWLEYNDALQEVPHDSEVIVGTGAQATWRLRRADLMPKHFIVTSSPDGGAAQIRPFSSDAVVSLNGRQLSCEPTSLADGDVIAAGSGQFRFWAATPSEDRAVLSAAPAPAIAHLIDGGRRSALFLNRISSGIGRDESNALVIDEASTFEAEIRREAGGHALRASSPSTVRVNGRPVSAPVLLAEGDEIQVGNRVLRYTLQPVEAEPVAAEPVRVSEALELTPSEVVDDDYAHLSTHPATVALRNPMRAVAFVSSVIAAVAIATLVFLHKGP